MGAIGLNYLKGPLTFFSKVEFMKLFIAYQGCYSIQFLWYNHFSAHYDNSWLVPGHINEVFYVNKLHFKCSVYVTSNKKI